MNKRTSRNHWLATRLVRRLWFAVVQATKKKYSCMFSRRKDTVFKEPKMLPPGSWLFLENILGSGFQIGQYFVLGGQKRFKISPVRTSCNVAVAQ